MPKDIAADESLARSMIVVGGLHSRLIDRYFLLTHGDCQMEFYGFEKGSIGLQAQGAGAAAATRRLPHVWTPAE